MKAKFLVIAQFGLLGALAFIKGERLLARGSTLENLAPVLYAAATLLLALAFVALRPSLRVSPIPREGAPLIVNGIYRWLRHPMYIAVLLFGAGLALRQLSVVSIALWLLLLIDLIVKAAYEDALLLKAHEKAHDYQRGARGILLTKKNEKRKR